MPKRIQRVIFKYGLRIADIQVVFMPDQAEILSVAAQDGKLCLWAIVNPESEKVDRHIEIIGTGSSMPSVERIFLGTVLMPPFVWHVFEFFP